MRGLGSGVRRGVWPAGAVGIGIAIGIGIGNGIGIGVGIGVGVGWRGRSAGTGSGLVARLESGPDPGIVAGAGFVNAG